MPKVFDFDGRKMVLLEIYLFPILWMMPPYESAWPIAFGRLWSREKAFTWVFKPFGSYNVWPMLPTRIDMLSACNLFDGKVCEPWSNTHLMQMPIIKWCVPRLVVKNGHQKTCVTMRLTYVLKTKTPFEVQSSAQLGGFGIW